MNPVSLSIDVLRIDPGPAILIIGMLALLLTAVIMFRNPAGVALWSMTVVMVAISALYGLGVEFVLMGMLFTALVTIIGVSARAMT